ISPCGRGLRAGGPEPGRRGWCDRRAGGAQRAPAHPASRLRRCDRLFAEASEIRCGPTLGALCGLDEVLDAGPALERLGEHTDSTRQVWWPRESVLIKEPDHGLIEGPRHARRRDEQQTPALREIAQQAAHRGSDLVAFESA